MGIDLQTQLQSFLVSGPERLAAEIVLGALVLIALSIYVNGPIGTLCRIAVFIGALAVFLFAHGTKPLPKFACRG